MRGMKSVFLPKDTAGNLVHAHGGQILFQDGYYYLIGENRMGRTKVSCWRSRDLEQWEFRGNLLTLDSPVKKHVVFTEPELDFPGEKASIGQGCNIERPKILYNRKYGHYVMWMHWERPADYREARCAVAVCDRLDGEYTYLGSFNPIGHMSRDCTVFQEENGEAYFISTARDNQDLHIYKLSEDYLSIDRLVRVLWPGQMREAPTVFKKDGIYYMLTSGCTGWAPNQSSWAWSTAIDGDWSIRYNFGDETTYHSQPTWVLPVFDSRQGELQYWYFGDRWGGPGDSYYQSAYVLLPIRFGEEHQLSLEWQEDIDFQANPCKLI